MYNIFLPQESITFWTWEPLIRESNAYEYIKAEEAKKAENGKLRKRLGEIKKMTMKQTKEQSRGKKRNTLRIGHHSDTVITVVYSWTRGPQYC